MFHFYHLESIRSRFITVLLLVCLVGTANLLAAQPVVQFHNNGVALRYMAFPKDSFIRSSFIVHQ